MLRNSEYDAISVVDEAPTREGLLNYRGPNPAGSKLQFDGFVILCVHDERGIIIWRSSTELGKSLHYPCEKAWYAKKQRH